MTDLERQLIITIGKCVAELMQSHMPHVTNHYNRYRDLRHDLNSLLNKYRTGDNND
jgi:hypothetical protein